MTHTYAVTGTYTVTLAAANACGEEVVSRTVTIGAGDHRYTSSKNASVPSVGISRPAGGFFLSL